MTLNKSNTRWGIVAATLTMASALVAPQALAGSKAELGNSKVQALESQVDEMGNMLRSMQSELDALRNQKPVAAPAPVKTKDNMVFFRGGFAHMDQSRNDILTGGQTALNSGAADTDAWYIGAGFDFSLTDDLWGAADGTEILAELMFEYKEFGTQKSTSGANTLCATAGGIVGTNVLTDINDCSTSTVSQVTLSASPKIKFLKGSDFRPWIIPIGLGIHIISPPSNGVTVFNPGMMFGAGADYKIWQDIYVGVDARYHLTSNSADGVNTDGYTAGGYLGMGF